MQVDQLRGDRRGSTRYRDETYGTGRSMIRATPGTSHSTYKLCLHVLDIALIIHVLSYDQGDPNDVCTKTLCLHDLDTVLISHMVISAGEIDPGEITHSTHKHFVHMY